MFSSTYTHMKHSVYKTEQQQWTTKPIIGIQKPCIGESELRGVSEQKSTNWERDLK